MVVSGKIAVPSGAFQEIDRSSCSLILDNDLLAASLHRQFQALSGSLLRSSNSH